MSSFATPQEHVPWHVGGDLPFEYVEVHAANPTTGHRVEVRPSAGDYTWDIDDVLAHVKPVLDALRGIGYTDSRVVQRSPYATRTHEYIPD